MPAIYHITNVQNLSSILAQDGLCCDQTVGQQQLAVVGIAHMHIKERRARRQVPVAAGGTLANYVPFYFGPRSPMLYTIHRGNVVGYNGGQQSIVHLVSSTEQAAQQGLTFAFSDGHAEMAISAFFDDLVRLDQIDWPLMQAMYWNDTVEDGDRKRRRQAEFLVHQFFPWTLVGEIGVMSANVAHQVQTILQAQAHQPPVTVHRDWYY